MGEEADMSPVATELMWLASETALSENLESCDGLAALILSGLEIPDRLAKGSRANAVRSVLFHVAREARRESEKVAAAGAKNNLSCRTAAFAELLALTDDEVFYRVRKKRRDDSEWEIEVAENTAAKRTRDLRASVWINLHSGTVRKRPYKELLPQAFETYIRTYVANHRDELAELVNRRLESEPSVIELEPSAPVQIEPPRQTSAASLEPTTRPGPYRPVDPSLQDHLAKLAYETQVSLERQHRDDKVENPFPMPVRWSQADQYPADHWGNVRGDRERSEPLSLSGMIDKVADLYESIPSHRLVVLGEGGAGKSVLVRELAIVLLQRRKRKQPLPVVFPIASWNPLKKSLKEWMVERLEEEHRGLRQRTKPWFRRWFRRNSDPTIAHRLVESGAIVPILDGLDELGGEAKSVALAQISRSLSRTDQVIVTSRPAEYVAAVQEGQVLAGAAVIALEDLRPDDLANYLLRTTHASNGRETDASWHAVVARMRDTQDAEGQVLRDALGRPLMAFLARSIYSEGSDEPRELLDRSRFPDAASITDHLLGRFIETKYGSSGPSESTKVPSSWTPERARRWLGFLATLLAAKNERELHWWNLYNSTSKFLAWPASVLCLALVTVFVWMLPFDFRIKPEAVWDGTTIIYQDRAYTRTNDGYRHDARGIPEDSFALVHVERSVFPWKAHYIYFPADVDVNTAIHGLYFDADFTPPDTFENHSGESRISVEKYRSSEQDYTHPEFWLSLSYGGIFLAYVAFALAARNWKVGRWKYPKVLRDRERENAESSMFIVAGLLTVPAVTVPLMAYSSSELGPFSDLGMLAALVLLPLVLSAAAITMALSRDPGTKGPVHGLRDDIWAGTILVILYVALICVATVAVTRIVGRAGEMDDVAILVVWFAFPVTLLVTAFTNSSGLWFLATMQLAVRGWVPFPLMKFLEHAYSSGVLRRSGSAYEFRHAELQAHLASMFIAENHRSGIRDMVALAGRNLAVSGFDPERLTRVASDELRSLFSRGLWSKRREQVVVGLLQVLRRHGRIQETLDTCRESVKDERDWRSLWRVKNPPRVGWSGSFLRRFSQEMALVDLLIEQGNLSQAATDFAKLVPQDEMLFDLLDLIDLDNPKLASTVRSFPRWAASQVGGIVWEDKYFDEIKPHMLSLRGRLEERGVLVPIDGNESGRESHPDSDK